MPCSSVPWQDAQLFSYSDVPWATSCGELGKLVVGAPGACGSGDLRGALGRPVGGPPAALSALGGAVIRGIVADAAWPKPLLAGDDPGSAMEISESAPSATASVIRAHRGVRARRVNQGLNRRFMRRPPPWARTKSMPALGPASGAPQR